MRVQTAALLGLGAACRGVFRWQRPLDLATSESDEEHLAIDLRHGVRFVRQLGPVAGLHVLELGSGFGGLLWLLNESGSTAVGVDIEPHRVRLSKERGLDARVASATDLPFADETFDLVASRAVLEHLPDIHLALREAWRVLKPGGRFYAAWGPSWLSYNGPHLVKVLGVPWIQLLFSDRTILEALEQQKAARRWPVSYLDFKIDDFQTMGRVTRRKLRDAATAAGFEIVEERSRSPRPIKNALGQLPLLGELLPGELTVDLRKHQLTTA